MIVGMSDLENVLRRLARLLQSTDETRDDAPVADDGASPAPQRERPSDRGDRARDLPHRGAASA